MFTEAKAAVAGERDVLEQFSQACELDLSLFSSQRCLPTPPKSSGSDSELQLDLILPRHLWTKSPCPQLTRHLGCRHFTFFLKSQRGRNTDGWCFLRKPANGRPWTCLDDLGIPWLTVGRPPPTRAELELSRTFSQTLCLGRMVTRWWLRVAKRTSQRRGFADPYPPQAD